MTVSECSLMSCLWAHFPPRFPHYTWTAQPAHSDFVGSRVYVCSGVTFHLHFWQNGRRLLHATAVTRGGADTKWESAKKVNPGEENSPAALAGALPTGFPGSGWDTRLGRLAVAALIASHTLPNLWGHPKSMYLVPASLTNPKQLNLPKHAHAFF